MKPGDAKSDTETLVDLMFALAGRQNITTAGQWTLRAIMQRYRAGSITEVEGRELAAEFLDDEKQLDKLFLQARQMMDSDARAKCVKGIKRRFLVGELTSDVAETMLAVQGLDLFQRENLVRGWKCELMTRRREPTVKMLIEWTTNGIITVQELFRRLMNLGFSEADAMNIISSQQVAWEKKRQAEELKALKAAQQAAADAAKKRQDEIVKRSRSSSRNGQS